MAHKPHLSLKDTIDGRKALLYNDMPIKVVITDLADEWCIYNEAGQMIEDGFTSERQAKKYAKNNGYRVVNSFNL